MKKCTFSELMEKEVINSCDCRRLGSVSDCLIELESGRICAIIVSNDANLFCLKKNPEKSVTIPWECIVKIGDDIILTDIAVNCALPPPKKK